MRHTAPTSERLAALGCAIVPVSAALDDLLEAGVLTTNFMIADQCGRSVKYVPAYLFSSVREAATCERFEDLSRDHAYFVYRMMAHVTRWVPGANTEPLGELKQGLQRFDRDSSEHMEETRCLHVARMLELGWSLLEEIAEAGLWRRDDELAADTLSVISSCAPPLRYAARDDVVRHAVDLLLSQGLEREADAARAFLHYNPAIHG
ncbi:hypothetical protein G6L37_03345 [Agrobacterium rubi]|nr:hypothetical protein [Agrobacterium rubi]NTF24406.1 hypothetical protein [Agrobacterium rubi]